MVRLLSAVDGFDLHDGELRAVARPAPTVLPLAELADDDLRALQLPHDLRRHRGARDERRADPAFAFAADEADLVERDGFAFGVPAAQVDLDAVAGLDPVLLVAIVDDGVHGLVSERSEG